MQEVSYANRMSKQSNIIRENAKEDQFTPKKIFRIDGSVNIERESIKTPTYLIPAVYEINRNQ